MNSYLYLLNYFIKDDIYHKYRKYLYLEQESKEIKEIYSNLDYLMNKYNIDITLEELELYTVTNASLEKYKTIFKEIFSFIRLQEYKETNKLIIEEILNEIKNKSIARELSIKALNVCEGREDYATLVSYWNSNCSFDSCGSSVEEDSNLITSNLEELINSSVTEKGLRWSLNILNKSLGSLRKGDFGFVFARPETGKTTFLACEVANFLKQTDKPILWINNEEQGNKVMLRVYQAFFSVTLQELIANKERYGKEFEFCSQERFIFIDSATISKRDIEQYCEKYQPNLIVIDQIDKIKGFTDDREDLRLGGIYIWAREIAKRFCPVIGVCQASGEAEGRKWLNMDMVANAKTAKQAEADFILGIGKVHDPGYEGIRHIHISKNKLIGDEDTEPMMRHGKFDIIIKPELAKYYDLY
jgi:replicative DNA helicase